MHEAVAARKDVHERAEPGDVHDPARVHSIQLNLRREHDGADALLGGGHRGTVGGGDGNPRAIVVLVHTDLRSGLLLEGVDDLALRADDLADLVGGDLERDDLGSRLTDIGARRVDGAAHHFQDLHPCCAGLVQRPGQHRSGNPVDLGVELQRRHVVLGTGDLEVHITEGILRTEDVGEGNVAFAVGDEAHGDARDRCLDRHARVHEREAGGAHRGHRGGAVGGEHLRHQPDRVRELLDPRDDRQQRFLGEGAVANLTPARPPHEPGLARAEGREVVVVHVALALSGVDTVHDLVHALRAQGGDVEDLRITPLEQTRTVGHGNDAHVGRKGTDVGGRPAVDATAVGEDPLPHDRLGERADGRLGLLLHPLDLRKTLGHRTDDRLSSAPLRTDAFCLVRNLERLRQLFAADFGNRVGDSGAVIDRQLVVHGGLHARRGDEPPLERHRLGHPSLRLLETLGQDRLVHLRGARLVVAQRAGGTRGLDHHHRNVTVGQDPPGDHHLEGTSVSLGVGGIGDPATVSGVPDAYGADGTAERDAGHAQCRRCGVERQHVVRVVLICAEHDSDDVDLIAKAVGEGGTQRPVDEATGQSRLVAGTALPPEERAGDLAGGEHALLDVDRQREEVGAFSRSLGRRGGDKNLGPAEAADHRGPGQCGQAAGLEAHLLVLGPANRARDGDYLTHS